MKSRKIVHSITGYLFGGPLGGILGYFTEDLTEQVKKHYQKEDNGVNLLLLGIAVVKAERKVEDKKIAFIRYYFEMVYGEKNAEKILSFIPKVLKESYNAPQIALEASNEYSYTDKLKILNYLFRIVTSGQTQDPDQWKMISVLANNLGIRLEDYTIIKKRYKETAAEAPYAMLGCQESDSLTIITNKYRKLVLQFHPDRIKFKNETERQEANRYFQKIREAYLLIKTIKSS